MEQIKNGVGIATVRLVLLYSSETWSLRLEDMRIILILEHSGHCSVGAIYWEMFVSSSEVMYSPVGSRV